MLIPHDFTLASGLKVRYFQAPQATFNIYILIKVGSRDEPLKYTGITHFLEHAMFRGSAKYPDVRQFHRELGNFSGDANGFTDRESLCFQFNGDAEKLNAGLEFIEDFFFCPQFSDLDKEKEVVIQEIYGDEDPLAGMETAIYGDLFKGSRFANTICGTEESVRNLTPKMLKAWRSKFLTPQNTTLYISSTQPVKEIEEKLTTLKFSRVWDYVKYPVTTELLQLNRRPPTFIKESFTVVHNPSPNSQFTCGFNFALANPTPQDNLALWMLSRILFKIEGVSPLWEATRGEGLVYDIGSDSYDFTNFMFSGITWETSPENVVQVFEIVKKELKKIAENNLNDWNYLKDRLLFKNRIALLESPITDIIEMYINKEIANYVLLPQERVELLANATPELLVGLATKILNGSKNWSMLGYRAKSLEKKLKSPKTLVAV